MKNYQLASLSKDGFVLKFSFQG